ncbi:MAG: 4-alpha-glucanotransferase [Croceicoccus sp.]|nr:4-alpha-glucanotransferase [Croceicoccus sp.]MAL25049.1 4-alpha-glucanotransferase [Croceicoccus sp.]|tara:strand:+ start:15782 stop:17782 length:2001 start_codon:yes stop_codon:yes gene_type:complete
MSEALHLLAAKAGLQIDWEDAGGQQRCVSDGSLRQVLAALGYPAEGEREIAESLARCESDAADCRFVSGDAGQPVALPNNWNADRAEIILEGGETLEVQIERTASGSRLIAPRQIGYHRLVTDGREWTLAVAPPQCLGPAELAPRARPWGTSVQVPSLRDERQGAFGDFGSLVPVAQGLAQAGADALAISPVHALFPADASRFSPYAPSSRLFLNILFGDPALVGEPVAPAEQSELIDWATAIPRRMTELRRAYENCGDAVRARVAAWRAEQGEELERHAIFDTLFARFFPDGASGWQAWPAEYRDPASDEVARFAAEHRGEVDFYIFAQWLAAASLDAAQDAARAGGMAIGLIADLAVGMDGGGSHAWSRREDLLEGLSIGAPPDPLGPQGQDWGLTGFSPRALKRTGFAGFIATLRAALDHAGGVRIDHVLGLNRLWVVPHSEPSAQGAYLRYPLDDMLRILAIESHRAGAIVIGEDLGTVPEGLRPRLTGRNVLGMRVLWFERGKDGGFVPPRQWPVKAAAMTGTHDTVTVAGWWRGRDIDWNRKLGRHDPGQSEAQEREARGEDRAKLWSALSASGAATGPQPEPLEQAKVVDAAARHVAQATCELAIVPLEDIAGVVEQPNLPGTTDEHPNWRRRMPADTGLLLRQPDIAARLHAIDRIRQ